MEQNTQPLNRAIHVQKMDYSVYVPFHISEERTDSSLNTAGDIDFFHMENYIVRSLPHTMDVKINFWRYYS